MSKKEIRRAARDAFPKAKNASKAKKGSAGGAYSKRSYGTGARQTGDRNTPKPPNLVRSLVVGVIVGFIYFVFIQWVLHIDGATTQTNVIFGVGGAILFACVNYLTESLRYRRYMRKRDGS